MRPLHPARIGRLFTAGAAGEVERLALWLPVAFGSGTVCYFTLTEEPSPLWPAALATCSLALIWLGRAVAWVPLAASGILLFAAGWGWSQLGTAMTAAPMLERELWGVTVSGRVVDLDPQQGSSTRVVLDRLAIERLAPEETPERVRITYRASDRPLQPGDIVEARAVLRPPSPPVAPRGYDFQREAWFAQIGAVGFALGGVTVREAGAGDEGAVMALALERVRRAIAEAIDDSLDGPAAALAVALVVGESGLMSQADTDAMRASGLSHLIAISGLHISIVAGFVFWITRAGLARIPAIAIRYPIKKWAAISGLVGALAYTLIAGLTPPTLRSFLMVAVALVAMMIDRNPISMRLLGVAALLVLLVSPSVVLGPSFQLSFAAVIGLIAGFERMDARRTLLGGSSGRPRNRFLVYLAAATYSSLIATVATTPFSLFHFQQVALYGIVANLLAIPLTTFCVVPLLAVGCVASLVGLGDIGFVPAGWGIEGIRFIAHTVAEWPGALLRTAAADGWTLVLAAVGGLWLCLWRSRIRWLGAAALMAGLVAMAIARPPQLFVSGTGEAIGVLSADAQRLFVSSLRRDRFTSEAWAQLAGLDVMALAALDAAVPDDGVRCDAFGCVVTAAGRRIAVGGSFDAVEADCALADLVILLYPGSEACPAGTPTVRYLDLVRDGAHTVTVLPDGEMQFESVGEHRGRRPWAVTSR